MWKITVLSALLSAMHGAKIEDIYGNYTTIMVYPTSFSVPMCVTMAFSEDPQKIKCSCSDGNDSTLVEMRMLERITPLGQNNDPDPKTLPMMITDNVNDLMSLMNVTCNCEDKEFNFRSVVKSVNENYLLIYVRNGPKSATHRNSDFLMARNLPSNAELDQDITLIDDVKHKNFSRMCTREIYEQLHKNN